MTGALTNGGIRVRHQQKCMLCGQPGTIRYHKQHDRLFDAPGDWDVLECGACQLLWLRTIPIDEDLVCVYPPSVVDPEPPAFPDRQSLKKTILNCFLKGRLGYHELDTPPGGALLGWLTGRCTPLGPKADYYVNFLRGEHRGTLLDVGCGTGGFLSRMQLLGWKTIGVEPDGKSAAVAERVPGTKICKTTLEGAGLSDASCDAITLTHVIEHLDTPSRTLQEVRRVLKPGGTVVVTTPNIRGLCHRRFGRDWYHLDVPRHLVMFSPRSLVALVKTCGLIPLSLFTISRQVSLTCEASQLIARHGRLSGYYRGGGDLSRLARLAAWAFGQLSRWRSGSGSGSGIKTDRTSLVGDEIVLILTKAV